MHLIIGLGNIGKQYTYNRHNIGFLFLDYLQSKYNLSDFKKKYNFLYSLNNHFNQNFVLLKPTTFMNLSGNAISSAMAFFKINIKNVLVVYDDVALPFGKIRIRESGSDGGHNGLKNIQLQLGTNEYKRIRIGIGAPEHSSQMKDYVLNNFNENEIKILNSEIFNLTELSMELIINNKLKEAMNKYNGIDNSKSDKKS